MTEFLQPITAPEWVYRLARKPDAWAPPDWAYAHSDGTFGNRYDDPDGVFRVLYASSERAGAFIETLARYRPSAAVLAGLEELEVDGYDSTLLPGHLDVAEWAQSRCIGRCRAAGVFADVGYSRSLAVLNRQLAPALAQLGIGELDAEAVRAADRGLTNLIARTVYASPVEGGGYFAGLMYRSRLGDDLHNWALFEGPEGSLLERTSEPIDVNDPDLTDAARKLGVTLVYS